VIKIIFGRKTRLLIACNSFCKVIIVGAVVVILTNCGGANESGSAQFLYISNASSNVLGGLNVQSDIDNPNQITLVEELNSTSVFTPVFINGTVFLGSFPSGLTTLTWSGSGSTEIKQKIQITPEITIVGSNTISEEKTSELVFSLSGNPVIYPVTVNYQVSGTADNTDHNLTNGQMIIESGLSGALQFEVLSDVLVEGTEFIEVTIVNATNAHFDPTVSSVISISENVLVPVISLESRQQNEKATIFFADNGEATISLLSLDQTLGSSHQIRWTLPNLVTDLDADDLIVRFDPANFTQGVYQFSVEVENTDDANLSSSQSISILLLDTEIVYEEGDFDLDLDQINDSDEGFGDDDQDGIPNLVDNSGFPENVLYLGGINVIEVAKGLKLRLDFNSFNLFGADFIDQFAEELNLSELVHSEDPDVVNSGDIIGFQILGLAEPGESVSIVLPQNTPIPGNAIYRKFINNNWQTFVENGQNSILSAPLTEHGLCPSLNDSDFESGLIRGYQCVKLIVEDGGPNDADGMVNSTVIDPGGIAVLNAETQPEIALILDQTVKSNNMKTVSINITDESSLPSDIELKIVNYDSISSSLNLDIGGSGTDYATRDSNDITIDPIVKSGSFEIKLQARDEFGNESEETSFTVTVKKSKKKESKFLGIGEFDGWWLFMSLIAIAGFRFTRCRYYLCPGKNN
jgi:hypothetical protein